MQTKQFTSLSDNWAESEKEHLTVGHSLPQVRVCLLWARQCHAVNLNELESRKTACLQLGEKMLGDSTNGCCLPCARHTAHKHASTAAIPDALLNKRADFQELRLVNQTIK
jgi:hypothetical protein